MTLYHYTCDHGHAALSWDEGVIPAYWQTKAAAGGPGGLAWFTDLPRPVADALGLTSLILSCDRTRHRYRVTDETGIVPWTTVRRDWEWAEALESTPGARPRHWFVADALVPVAYDPVREAVRT